MADTQFKGIAAQTYSATNPGRAAFPNVLMRDPFVQSLRAQDRIGSGRRVLASQSNGGVGEWLVSDEIPGGLVQKFPEPDVWRTVGRSRQEVTAGHVLIVRAVAATSGATERFNIPLGEWEFAGVGGRVRVIADWTNGTDTASVITQFELPHVPESEFGAQTDLPGTTWAQLIYAVAATVAPPDFDYVPGEAAKWAEWPVVELTLQHQGGARVVDLNVCELPKRHTIAHDDPNSTYHDYPPNIQQPTTKPQIADEVPATFEEPRFGTHRSMIAAARQAKRLGPRVAWWTPYSETSVAVDDVEVPPVAITTTTPTSPSSGVTEWEADAPGFDIPGAYAKRFQTRLDGAAVLEVRARVYARMQPGAASGGIVRFQSSPRSWMEVEIPPDDTFAWHTATAFIEANVDGDDDYALLIDLARVLTNGDVMEVGYWDITQGAWPTQ